MAVVCFVKLNCLCIFLESIRQVPEKRNLPWVPQAFLARGPASVKSSGGVPHEIRPIRMGHL